MWLGLYFYDGMLLYSSASPSMLYIETSYRNAIHASHESLLNASGVATMTQKRMCVHSILKIFNNSIVNLVEQKISFQMIPNMLGSGEYQGRYTSLIIVQSGPLEIGKYPVPNH